MSGLSTEEVMRLVMQAVPSAAQRATASTTVRLATVDATQENDDTVQVMVDGDDEVTVMANASGQRLCEGERVVVLYYPPHGVAVIGAILTTGQVGYFTGDAVAGFGAVGQTLVSLRIDRPMFAARRYRAYLTTNWWSDVADTVLDLELQYQDASDVGVWDLTTRAWRSTNATAGAAARDHVAGHVDFSVPADGFYDFRVYGYRVAGTGTCYIAADSCRVSIDDVGMVGP